MDIIIYTLIAVFAVSLVSLVGVFFLSMSEKRLSALMHLLVGLAAGALLGDAIVHLIPEAFEAGLGSIAFSVTTLTGVLIFFILEKYLRWHHHEHDTGHTHVPSEAELVATPGAVSLPITSPIYSVQYPASLYKSANCSPLFHLSPP